MSFPPPPHFSTPKTVNLKAFHAILLISLAGLACAQPYCLRNQRHGIESPNYYHPTVWVCTGDTLSVVTDANGQQVYTIDGFWITCDEITVDLWRWYSFVDRTPAKGDSLPVTGKSHEEIDRFLDVLTKSTNQEWRLPTRDEWLFAFHGGIFGDNYHFSGSNSHHFVAWSKTNSRGTLHPGGMLISNDLGINDMSGNAAEMVTIGDSIAYIGGCYLDNFDKPTEGNTVVPCVDFPPPPPEARGFRLVCREALSFNKDCERVFYSITQ